MAGLVIPSSVTVPVAIEGGAERQIEEIGDRGRTFNGSAFTSVRAWKDNHKFRTAPVSSTLAASIKSSLQGSQPLACYGDLIGISSSTTGNFHGKLVSEAFSQATTARLSVLELELLAE